MMKKLLAIMELDNKNNSYKVKSSNKSKVKVIIQNMIIIKVLDNGLSINKIKHTVIKKL